MHFLFEHLWLRVAIPASVPNQSLLQATDAEGQPLTYLTIVCKPEDGDDVAAALLQVGLINVITCHFLWLSQM
jgi:hypothetical protein